MNRVFRPYLHNVVAMFIDDILIYSKEEMKIPSFGNDVADLEAISIAYQI